MKERLIAPEEQLKILEELKPRLGRLFNDLIYGQWGLSKEDTRLVDEAGFGYTGIPIYGPELIPTTRPDYHLKGIIYPHIDIAVKEDKYRGPRNKKINHPLKIIFPMATEGQNLPQTISNEYELDVFDLLKASDKTLSLPKIEVILNGIPVLIPEPVSHVRAFAQDTILFYDLTQVDDIKLKEWFIKLKMIRDTSMQLKKTEVQEVAEEMINKSIERWKTQEWQWLVLD